MKRDHACNKHPRHQPLSQRSKSVRLICCFFLMLILGPLHLNEQSAYAQTRAPEKSNANNRLGKVGKGKRDIQQKTCLVPVKIRGMNEGDLAEVLDAGQNRVAIVRLVRLDRPAGRLAAQVIVGEEKCASLNGFTIRPLTSFAQADASTAKAPPDSIASLSAQFVALQFALPGLALNKFLTPGYTQRGFGARTSATFPRKPAKVGKVNMQASIGVLFSSTATAPAIDIIKDGKVLGTQKFSTTAIHARTGVRALTSDSRLWTEAGAIVFDSLSSKSALTKSSADVDVLFPAVREMSGQGFGVFLEQGAAIGENVRVSLSGGLGLGTKYKTPVVEDGEATNTSENFNIEGLPFFASFHLNLALWGGMFSEVSFDYSNVKLVLPLVNEQQSKSQIEKLSLSVGAGYRF